MKQGFFIAIVAIVTVFTVHQTAGAQNRGGANADQPEVEAVLEEIRALIRDHYKIPPKPVPEPTPESIAEANLEDDIRYTLPQVQQILSEMKQRWGYEVRQPRLIPNTSYYWTFPIKYAFNASQHTDAEKATIRAGIQLWIDNTCATYEEHENQTELVGMPHILVYKGSGCSSYVGNINQVGQTLSIGPGCDRVGTVAHEFGHALGVNHEQCRPDRDDHIQVVWENIEVGKEHNFLLKEDLDLAETGYDFTSVMHYSSMGFSIDSASKKRTIMPHDVHHLTAIGQRARLQFNDIKRVNFAYGCITKNCRPDELSKPCQNGGYQDPKNCAACRCPPGTAGVDCGSIEPASGAGMTDCGGETFIEPCSIKTLTIPPYPSPYGEDFSCTWKIKSPASGLAFAFQTTPDMPCSSGDTCYDFVEIRTNMSRLDIPGRFFCKCGENKGRVVTVDNTGEALVRFASTTLLERSGAGKSTGFLLNVYATCNDTLTSQIPNSCVITSTGFESCSGVSLPMCDADEVEMIDPVVTTTTATTPSTTRSTVPVAAETTTLGSSSHFGSYAVVFALVVLQAALSSWH